MIMTGGVVSGPDLISRLPDRKKVSGFKKRHHLSLSLFMITTVLHSQIDRRNAMFWIFMLITTLAFMLVKLGALSLIVTVLSSALYLGLLIIAGLVIALLWRKVSGRQDRTPQTKGAKQIQNDGEMQR